MKNQFFVCHSSSDEKLAETLVNELESAGINCWLASRDQPEGPEKEKYVSRAILDSTAVILIFSENSSDSTNIRSELDITSNQRIPIIPLKFHNTSVSKTISYYTDSYQWIDCEFLQTTTPEITETIFALIKKSIPKKPTTNTADKRNKILIASSILLILFLVFLALNNKKSSVATAELINIAVGGRDSWDAASDIVATVDGGIVVAGSWDWGYWSEIWVLQLDHSATLISTWSDSVAGVSKPLLLATADGGFLVAYNCFSETEETNFRYRSVRFNSWGNVMWSADNQVQTISTGEPILSSLNWFSDSTAIASFTVRYPIQNNHSVHFAKFRANNGEGSAFTLPGNVETINISTSSTNQILHVSKSDGCNSNDVRILNNDGQPDHIIENDLSATITNVEYTCNNTIIAAKTTGGDNGILSVVEFSENSDIHWENSFDNNIIGTIHDITILPEGLIVLVGSTAPNSAGYRDGRVICLNSSGKLLWESIIETPGDNQIFSVDNHKDGTLLLAGSTTGFGDEDVWFLTMAPNGDYNNTCTIGLDLFTEDWENGFLRQSHWVMNSSENNLPSVFSNSANNHVLAINNGSIISTEAIKLVPGLCFSAELTNPNSQSSPTSWISIGTLSSITNDDTDCELRWNLDADENITVTSRRISPLFEASRNISLTEGNPVVFTIENYADSVLFRVDENLISTVQYLNKPDSIRFFVSGSTLPESQTIDNIRVYLRKW